MNRKADTVLVMIIELLAVVMIIFIIMESARTMSNTEPIRKKNMAEDFRMMTETLVSLPGDSVVEYPKNVSEFILILSNSGISVFKEGDSEAKQAKLGFYLPLGYIAEGSLNHETTACLEKKDKKIILRTCQLKERIVFKRFMEMIQTENQGLYSYDAGPQATVLYFKENGGIWQWSPDQENWMSTDNLEVSAGKWQDQKPVKENVQLIQFLEEFHPKPGDFKK